MKNPWVKLYRSILNDEKVSFIIRRYGHDCLTFWIGILTKCEDGVLTMDEEIFADLCLLETKRYEEIRGVFIKRGLVALDEAGCLVVINWDEYQTGESTERVRKYRDQQRAKGALPETPPVITTEPEGNATVTACNGDETRCNAPETEMERSEGEGELEGEEEGEGERASAPPAPDLSPGEKATAEAIVLDWYQALSAITWTQATPSPKSRQWAEAVLNTVRGDMAMARRLREEYFASWRDLWFAVARGGMQKDRETRTPDFDFRAYCVNVVTLAGRISAGKPKPSRRSVPAEPPPSLEERAAASALLSQAAAGTPLGAILGAAS